MFAIMVCLDGKDDWIFVTEDTGKCDWILKPMLFEDVETAFEYAEGFTLHGKEQNIRVVSYDES
jgi:hypothetical protein